MIIDVYLKKAFIISEVLHIIDCFNYELSVLILEK